MPASQARRLCPTAIVIPPDFTAYREKSREVWELVRARLDRLQSMGLDEAYADLTGVEKPLRVLRELIDEVAQADRHPDLGRRRARSRLIAKCCSDLGKPAGLRGDGPRGGVHPLRAPRRRAGCRASARRPPSAWPSSATRPSRQLQEADEAPARRALRRPQGALPEGARDASTTTRRWRPRAARPSRSPPSAPSTRTSPPTTSSRRSCARSRKELCEGLQRKGAPGPHGRDQGPPRRLDDGHPRAHAARRDQRHRAGHRDGAWSCCAPTRRRSRCGCSACGWRRSTTSSRTGRRRRSRRCGQLALPL